MIFVGTVNNPDAGFLAFASHLNQDAETYRPTFGRVIFNLDKLINDPL
jgi:hypothetical protein